MSLKDEITENVEAYMRSKYEIVNANVIPDKQSIRFGAHAKKMKHAVVMYADLRASRSILSDNTPLITARVHKAFLYAASKCVRRQQGELRSFNGDSVLAFFIGKNAEKRAVISAMKIKCAVVTIINPIVKEKTGEKLNFGIGIGKGEILVVKSGVSGEEMYQDLVWIGWPTYHAFEYGDRARSPKNIWISKNIFNAIKDDDNLRYSNGKYMWSYDDTQNFSFGGVRIYKTSYYWNL